MLESLDPDTILTLSTLVGEAGNSSNGAWKAVAHVICNRVGKREWAKLLTPGAVCQYSGFDAETQRTQGFREAMEYFSSRISQSPEPHLEEILLAVHPIIKGIEPDNTGNALLYFSPRTQAALHAKFPDSYAMKPKWNFDVLKQVFPPNLTPADDFLMYTYI